MKSWVFAAVLISGCALVACGDDGNTPSGSSTTSSSGSSSSGGGNGSGGGGGNGGNGGSGGSGGAGGEGGASATSTSSTGTPTCDDTTDTCGRDTNTGCYKCAVDGPCKEVRKACVDSSDCRALVVCIDGCAAEADPAACIETCRTDNAAGVEAYDALLTCTVCEECAERCDAAGEPVCGL
ncbi:hypothetical protein [Sorangium atrum]|uniref:Secreted protein n=1 Tax=Sorangium atrum TaxID=2995308 RepID=A0ABT5CEA4_9BACT|nr:hypothetical protein [Sorangium aterium]MDC0684702.1 hypothetical protein [Sorangium aterium]